MTKSVLVVGAGSIGARHARNLSETGVEVTLMDPNRVRAEAVGVGDVVDFDLRRADGHDAVLLASPTVYHAEQLAMTLPLVPKVFVEKPMVATRSELGVIAGHHDRIMVGCNLRFHPPIAEVREMVAQGVAGDMVAGRFWFGSWLPDWRPKVDYRETYSARSELGGGVLMDAIHEIDLVLWFFGSDLEVVGAIADRLGPLDIDVEDTVRALLRRSADRVPIELALDLLSRGYRRGLEIIGTEATVRFDWQRDAVEIDRPSGTEAKASSHPIAASYMRQTERFVDWLEGGLAPPVDGRVGSAAIELADAIRTASDRRP